jgi:hypothetical protein
MMSPRILTAFGLIAAITVFEPGMTSAQTPGADAASQQSQFDDFRALRADLTAQIGGAGKRVWIITDFMTDADIVSSLYIAQYRKVQIKVMLGKEKAANILSRLNYLRQVNIPTGIRPRALLPGHSTVIVIDDNAFSISTPLDYMTKVKKLTKSKLPAGDFAVLESAFQSLDQNAPLPEATPLPQVGRAAKRHKSPAQEPTATGRPIQTGQAQPLPEPEQPRSGASKTGDSGDKPSGTLMSNGSYRYRATKDKPSNGIPTKLPKTTIFQQREMERRRDGSISPGSDDAGSR